MGPYSSAVSEAVANVTEKYKKVMVAPLAATTSIFKKGRKYIFMVDLARPRAISTGLVDMAAKRGLKTVAIINEDTLFPKASAAGAAELAKKRGMQVVLQEAYPKGNTDFSALLVKIKAANPDVIAAGTYFDDAVAHHAPDEGAERQPEDVRASRWAATCRSSTTCSSRTRSTSTAPPSGTTTLPYPGQKEFFAAYKKEFKHEPSYHSAAGYARLPHLRRGGQARGHARRRQGARRSS